MSEKSALLAAIWENPHEDALRLVYADWLQERGEEERAEFIRVQCELANRDEWDPDYPQLKHREKELQRPNDRRWRHAIPSRFRKTVFFERGFPILHLHRLAFEDLLRLTVDDLKSAPLTRYHYALPGDQLESILAWPGLKRQQLFSPRPRLNARRLADGWVERIVNCSGLRNVSELCFIDLALMPGEVRMALDAWADRHLPRLALAGEIGDEGAAVLAAHPTAAKLRELDLRQAGLTGTGLRMLLASEHLTDLRVLDLWNNPVGDEGLIALAASPRLAKIRRLVIGDGGIGDAGATALAASPHAVGLRRLYFGENPIGEDGLQALLDSPYLSGLTDMTLATRVAIHDRQLIDAAHERFAVRIDNIGPPTP